MKPSSIESNIEGEEVGYGIFADYAFENSQIVVIYIGIPCGGNEVIYYAITYNCDIKPTKLNVEGGYPDCAELYIGDHMLYSPNDPNMDSNRDRSKYTCQFIGDFTIVTTRVIKEGEDFIIDCIIQKKRIQNPLKNTIDLTNKLRK